VSSYRAAREAEEQAREEATKGYRTEVLIYGPLITFRDWLTQSAFSREWDDGADGAEDDGGDGHDWAA
jgi:hypothetical protein